MTKWFYHNNQTVKGPVSTEELQNLIATFSDAQRTFIWSRGYTEWISADRWQPQTIHDSSYNEPNSATEELTQTNYNAAPDVESAREFQILEEKTHAFDQHTNDIERTEIPTTEIPSEKYRVQLNFVDQPAMTKDELMIFASRVDDPSQIAIFDPKFKEWKEIYSFKEIVEKLGLTRRKHPRVPILAQFSGTTSRHEKFNARLVTISIGGLGLTDVFDLNVGDAISGQITSPHFYSPVTIEAEATYCGNDGYVGLKFTQINDDSQSLVTDYVKRFSNNA
jgi:hypothetical protein